MSDVRDRKNILDIFVVWHPGAVDGDLGRRVFWDLSDHFNGPSFSGLAGGAIDVYQRSVGWKGEKEAPRPLGISSGEQGVPRLTPSQFNVIIPVVSTALRQAVQDFPSWKRYMQKIAQLYKNKEAFVYPIVPSSVKLNGLLGDILRVPQRIHSNSLEDSDVFLREVCQAISQDLSGDSDTGGERVRVFISHTRQVSEGEEALDRRTGDWGESELAERIRGEILQSRLVEFFDSTSIRTGEDWQAQIESQASSSAMLMIRTDKYARRNWPQREVAIAKYYDAPIVSIYAFSSGEEQGSFIMDHIPTVKLDEKNPDKTVRKALSKLLDEVLKRELWKKQKSYFTNRRGGGFDWMPANAPEPVTFVDWLAKRKRKNFGDELWVIHPDPPIGQEEARICARLVKESKYDIKKVNIVTPRTFRTRGGISPRRGNRSGVNPEMFPPTALKGVSVAISVSAGSDLNQNSDIEILGFSPSYRKLSRTPGVGVAKNKRGGWIGPVGTSHLSLVVAEIARAVFLAGGKVLYGGRIWAPGDEKEFHPLAFTDILLEEAWRYGDGGSGSEDVLSFYLPYCEYARIDAESLQSRFDYLGNNFSRVCFLSETGEDVDFTDVVARRPKKGIADSVRQSSLTAMRKRMAQEADARIVVGGTLSGFSSEGTPGILEEAQTCLEANKPLYIAGGFGGASALLAKELLPQVLSGDRGEKLFSWAPDDFPRQSQDPEERAAIKESITSIRKLCEPGLPENGLDDRGIEKLAITHRPSDIATLLVLGLSTKFNRSTGKGEEGA